MRLNLLLLICHPFIHSFGYLFLFLSIQPSMWLLFYICPSVYSYIYSFPVSPFLNLISLSAINPSNFPFIHPVYSLYRLTQFFRKNSIPIPNLYESIPPASLMGLWKSSWPNGQIIFTECFKDWRKLALLLTLTDFFISPLRVSPEIHQRKDYFIHFIMWSLFYIHDHKVGEVKYSVSYTDNVTLKKKSGTVHFSFCLNLKTYLLTMFQCIYIDC